MLDWLTTLGQKTDHPMHSIEEAERLLTGLADEPPKALEEIASWLTTIASAAGFELATRIAVIKLVDETGQPFEPLLNQAYLKSSALTEFERQQLWQYMLEFWQRVADAYRMCLDEMKRDPRLLRAHRHELPLLIARALRALATRCKVLRLRYLPVHEELWQSLFDLYQFSEIEHCDNQRVTAYEGESLPTTPRVELLRALMLDIARPESMSPQQTELAARIAARYADALPFKPAAQTGCNWYVDLAQPRAPELVTGIATLQPTARFFGGGAALVKIREAIRRLTAERDVKEQRFGNEYTAEEKLAVLKRVAHFWGEQPPHRREPRHRDKAEITVTLGYPPACQLAPRAEFSGWAETIVTMDAALKAKLGITTEPVNIPQEKWLRHDASTRGLSVQIPRARELRVRIGTLLAWRENSRPCSTGIVRRLYRDVDQCAYAGVEILGKTPVTVVLRRIGHGGMQLAHYAATSDSSASDYMNAILLGAGTPGDGRNELLLGRGEFVAGFIFEVLLGDTKQHLKFEEIVEQGVDFDRIRFAWSAGGERPRDATK